MITDSLLLLAICAPVLLWGEGPLRWCAAVMLASFISVTGYEWLTGGYAVEGVYILIDLICTAILSFLLLHGWSRPALLVLLGFWVCNIIHGLKLIIDPRDLNLYWWSLRFVNACQLLVLGGGYVLGGGKRSLWRRAVRTRGGRGDPDPALAFAKRTAR